MRTSHPLLQRVFVYAIAVGCLAWVLHDIRLGDLLRRMRSLQLWWIPAALITDVLSTTFHGLRWKFLLHPSGRVDWRGTTQAIFAGLFVSAILPLRAGEFVRGYVVSRRARVPFTAVLPSMITERVCDGWILVLGLAVASLFVALPVVVARAGFVAGAAMVVVTGLLSVLAMTERRPPKELAPHADRLRRIVHRVVWFFLRLATGLRAVWSSPQFLPALAVTAVFLALQMVSFGLVMKACELDVSIWVPAVVLVIVRLGTAIPSAPANIGPYQFFCVLGLMVFGVDKTTATGFAIVISIVLALPILTLGCVAFVTSDLSLSEVHKRHRPGLDG